MTPPKPRTERLLAVAIALACVALMVRPVLSQPLSVGLGAQASESPRHLWALWATTTGLAEWGPFVAHLDLDYPTGYTRHLMDPANLVFFAPVYALLGGGLKGAYGGYLAVHAGWTVLAALGGWLLARRLAGPGLPALLAGLACGTAPYLLATPALGRVELLPGVAWPLHLFLLHRALSPECRPRDVVAAGLSLAWIALGGWYLAAWLALLEPPVALAMGAWRAKARTAAVAALAVVPVLPALWALLNYPPPALIDPFFDQQLGVCTPPKMLLPLVGKTGLPGVDLPAYPGTLVVLLGLLGAAWDRRARGWVALGVVILALSLGPRLVFVREYADLVDPPLAPAGLLALLVPPLEHIWGWCRIGVLATMPFAVAAAFGLRALSERLPSLSWQLPVLVAMGLLVDQAQDRAPMGVAGRTFDAAPPAELVGVLDGLPPGALLQLPFDDAYATWQPSHGRPVAESLELESVLATSYLAQEATRVLEAEQVPESTWTRTNYACISADARALGEAGFAAVILHRNRQPGHHAELSQLLNLSLGTSAFSSQDLEVWPMQGDPAPEWLDCPLVPVRRVVPGSGASRLADPRLPGEGIR